MAKEILTLERLAASAGIFCERESSKYRPELFGVTDGKAVGTFVEHRLQQFLESKYDMTIGSSANGLDLPSINTDIKVTSIRQPQSSCPFKDSKQKIYGLGYNLIVFVYEKHDDEKSHKGMLDFLSCTLIESRCTGDYQTATGLRNIINNNGNVDDVFAFLIDHNIPSDEVSLMNMAKEIVKNPPAIGYLTISNALQWRLQYSRIVNIKDNVDGVKSVIKYESDKQ